MSPPRRLASNPILTPAALAPSRADLRVVGVFNPAALASADGVELILRVAEAPRGVGADDEVAAIAWDPRAGAPVVRRFSRGDPDVDASDPRAIVAGGETYLTSISHLRRARSRDGERFEVDPAPLLAPARAEEAYGVEDPRATRVDGLVAVSYTAVSARGIAAALALGPDLDRLERRGVIFPPPNRNVTVFPERVGGRYLALHRPMPQGLGRPSIWLAESDDLVRWGGHRFVAGPRPGRWDGLKVGPGAPPIPIRVEGRDAWLAIYHGVSGNPTTYSLGALLLDRDDPGRVLARSRAPVLAPEAPYERAGFFDHVVFTCGAVLRGDAIRIYYGAADGVTAAADVPLVGILEGVEWASSSA